MKCLMLISLYVILDSNDTLGLAFAMEKRREIILINTNKMFYYSLGLFLFLEHNDKSRIC